jgi:hypothetical protein
MTSLCSLKSIFFKVFLIILAKRLNIYLNRVDGKNKLKKKIKVTSVMVSECIMFVFLFTNFNIVKLFFKKLNKKFLGQAYALYFINTASIGHLW